MSAERPFELLSVSELRRLMELAVTEGLRTHEVTPQLVKLFGALAADVGFELWSREQARVEVRRQCGRSADRGHALCRLRGH